MPIFNNSYTSLPNDEHHEIGGNMGKNLNKFLLLMWKNWKLQYRRPLQTVIEILAPILCSMLLVVIRSLVDPELHDTKLYEPFCPLSMPMFCENPENPDFRHQLIQERIMSLFSNYTLLYSPANNTELDRAMNFYKISYLNYSFSQVIAYEDSKKLEAGYLTSNINTTFAALQFDDDLAGKETLPNNVNLRIRFPSETRSSTTNTLGQNNWLTNLLYPVYQIAGPRSPDSNTGAYPDYYTEGFLALQMTSTYILIMNKITDINDPFSQISAINDIKDLLTPVVKMQRFPYSKWMEDPLLTALESMIGMIFMLSFVYTCINTVKSITAEKEKQLKEAMKIMGLSNWLHWTAWFLKSFIFLFISVVLMVVLLTVSWYPNTTFSVFSYANPFVVLLFFVLYICATITFCFAVSVFFSKANTASIIAGLAWFIFYYPYTALQQDYITLNLSTKLFSSLCLNTAMAYGVQIMVMYEGTGEGIQWGNIWKTSTPDDNLTLGLVIIMLLVDTLIYLLIALYVEAVFPGEYGVPQPWYFFCTSEYWFGQPRSTGIEDFQSIPTIESGIYEKEPQHLQPGIQINNLNKTFNHKVAVRNMSLNMYKDQITVLLGHNGAGKTTTMSMLTGIIPPTSGTAVIEGHDIRRDMSRVRESLGICPQHNILFDDLTVEEHIYFYSKLKGLDGSEVQSEIKKYVEILELRDKVNAKASTLSGGMKRKLSVGMALCGRSKVVMLDEPTAGMDPAARRALWNLLQAQKVGRTLLLTTHYMDEADLLGDRIAIMAGGKLQCCGSSFFLKKKYGAGYHLIIEKTEQCNVEDVTNMLRTYIPDIKVNEDVGSELSYLLAKDYVPVFEQLLDNLESNSERLHILSYGISLTTLEEVFMKVGADHGQEETYNGDAEINGNSLKSKFLKWTKNKKDEDSHRLSENTNGTSITIDHSNLLTGFALIQNQYMALVMKKTLSFIRTWHLQLIQILTPTFLLIIVIIVARQNSDSTDLPELQLTLDSYSNPVTLREANVPNNYSDIFKQVIESTKHLVKTVGNITDEMLTLTATIPATVRNKFLVGASFDVNERPDDAIIAWFNNDAYHTPPLALGLVLNTVYKNALGNEHSIAYSNYPLPSTPDVKIKNLLDTGSSMGFQIAFNIGFSMAFVSSFYILFYVRERVCKSKLLQYVSGANALVFWTTSYIIDLLTFLLTACIMLFVFLAYQEDGFKTAEDLGRIYFLLFLFGYTMLPMMYFAAFLFDIPSTGYTRMTLFSITTGVIAFLVVKILETQDLNLKNVAEILNWLFLIVPHYAISSGISNSYTTYASAKLCNFVVETCMENQPNFNADMCWSYACHNYSEVLSNYCCEREPNYYKWEKPGIGPNVVYSLLTGSLLFILLLLVEMRIVSKLIYKVMQYYRRKPIIVQNEDSDVVAEKARIHDTPQNVLLENETVVLKDVTKYYKKFLAVNGLCLGIKRYECFGLLGINGAGKTTTFKMMTGDISITYGDAWVNGLSIKKQLKQVQKVIGYCPQFDALLDDMTARETITMFALLRGVPLDECKYLAHKLASDFDFNRHLDKKVKEMSGGNKRKLSTAIALIGNPLVLYLDEPTAGMDPATKRFLWDCLCKLRSKGMCIVLTSHSMEECEALCTRIAIMVNGQFKCLGSTQHLKSKFADGYMLTIKLKKLEESSGLHHSNTTKIEEFVQKNFPKAVQREKHEELLTYFIQDKSIPCSQMFGIMERGKELLSIEDYSLGQSSLEQVFLNFTKVQY